jgi:hypothetical protein
MMVARIEGATRHIGESQGYDGLPVRDEVVHCTVNGPGTPSMVTAWTPTPQERAAGGRLGAHLPPRHSPPADHGLGRADAGVSAG